MENAKSLKGWKKELPNSYTSPNGSSKRVYTGTYLKPCRTNNAKSIKRKEAIISREYNHSRFGGLAYALAVEQFITSAIYRGCILRRHVQNMPDSLSVLTEFVFDNEQGLSAPTSVFSIAFKSGKPSGYHIVRDTVKEVIQTLYTDFKASKVLIAVYRAGSKEWLIAKGFNGVLIDFDYLSTLKKVINGSTEYVDAFFQNIVPQQ